MHKALQGGPEKHVLFMPFNLQAWNTVKGFALHNGGQLCCIQTHCDDVYTMLRKLHQSPYTSKPYNSLILWKGIFNPCKTVRPKHHLDVQCLG